MAENEKEWKQCEVLNIRSKGKSQMWLTVDKYNLKEGSLVSLKHSDDIYRIEKIYDTELSMEQLNYNRASFASLK